MVVKDSLKDKVVKGFFWDGFQKFGTMIIAFVSNIILARLLMPDDFGTLGLIMTFVAISNAFIDGGFASALIQKGNPSNEDLSSVFFLNLIISCLFYILLYVVSPKIGVFFHLPLLADTLRVTGVVLILNALSIIQLTRFQINLNFKKRSQIHLIASLIGTMSCIIMAIAGWGVWSLVYRTIISSAILCLLVWSYGQWHPIFHFSFRRVKSLFKFGGFIFLSTLVEYIYANLQPVIIGRFFTLSQLGYFTQARKIEEIPTNTLTGIISTVTFPVYSKLKDDKEMLKKGAKKSIMALSYISIPLMMLMIITAHPLIVLLFGEKWEGSSDFLKILCIAGIFRIPSGINMNLIQSIGKSKSFMLVQVLKRILGIIPIIIGSFVGIMGLMWGVAIASMVYFIIDSLFCTKYLNYGLKEEVLDMMPHFCLALLSSIVTITVVSLFHLDNNLFLLSLDMVIFITIYILLSRIMNSQAQTYVFKLIKQKMIER